MRLFVATRPPADALDHLDRALERVREESGCPGLRWPDRARWHLTLAFLGDVDDDRVVRIADRVATVAARHAPVGPLRLAGAGVFGRRLLWVGVTAGVEAPGTDDAGAALRRLAVDVQHGMRREGVRLESRRWRPHLTVARQRGEGADAVRAAAALAGYRGPVWTVDSLLLVRSTLGPDPRHDVLREAVLSCAVRPGPDRPRGPAPS